MGGINACKANIHYKDFIYRSTVTLPETREFIILIISAHKNIVILTDLTAVGIKFYICEGIGFDYTNYAGYLEKDTFR